MFDSYVEPNLSNLITNQAKIAFVCGKMTGALNEELLETSYNELEIYQDWRSITAFPDKLNIKVFFTPRKMTLIFFPASFITWVNYVLFFTNVHNFGIFSKIFQSSEINLDNAHFTKVFEKSPSRCISSCQQDIKLDQFSQQNTHFRTAILQNSSLGA